MSSKLAGYPGTPLAEKLGITERSRVATKHAPEDYTRLLKPIPPGAVFEKNVSQRTDIVHVFSDRKASLEAELVALRKSIGSDAAVWVSWPKPCTPSLSVAAPGSTTGLAIRHMVAANLALGIWTAMISALVNPSSETPNHAVQPSARRHSAPGELSSEIANQSF